MTDFFKVIVPCDEREEPQMTLPFVVRGVAFLRLGIGGRWGCFGVEIPRPNLTPGLRFYRSVELTRNGILVSLHPQPRPRSTPGGNS